MNENLMADFCGPSVLMVVASVVSIPTFVGGAPAYTNRHPHMEQLCSHFTVSHATLCWAVQLKSPLHFDLPPPQVPSQTPSVSSVQLQPAEQSSQSQSLKHETSSLHLGAKHDDVKIASNLADSPQPAVESDSVHSSTGVDNSSLIFEPPSSYIIQNGSQQHFAYAAIPASAGFATTTSYSDEDLFAKESFTKENDGEISLNQKMQVYHQLAQLVAEDVELRLLGPVGALYDHFVLCHHQQDGQEPGTASGSSNPTAFQHYHKAHLSLREADEDKFQEIVHRVETALLSHHDINWFTRETIHRRQKRSLTFNDPAFPHQWHLVNKLEYGMDINVTAVWERGFTGRGVTVAVVDDGLEWRNPDIHNNYNYLGSWDLNDNDPDPTPNSDKVSNHHGTRCAGEIAAVANNHVCGVGVAYGAKVAGIRLLDGPMTDSLEAEAFNKKFDVNAVYSCSWGPDDDGKTVDGPHILAAKAMKYGVEFGRHGYGSIFVVASGNGGSKFDNCNYDGYANSIYTVTIGAVDESGKMPYYAEECASMLGVTFSSGIASKRDIVTTDWQQKGSTGCTERHTGTSAAAPLVGGMIALMLQAQPCLTWRDVQYIIIITSIKVDVDLAEWHGNKAGLQHSHKHGFGLIKAWRLVNAARVWRSVPYMTSYSQQDTTGWDIPHGSDNPLTVIHTVTSKDISGYNLYILEYVQVTVTLTHPVRGTLSIHLSCPSGTTSVIGAPRARDNSTEGFTDWTFTTVRCWGEEATGDWSLSISDSLAADMGYRTGHLTKWRLTLFGTPMTPDEFQDRRREVEAAMNGQYLTANITPRCEPPPVTTPPFIPLSEKTLKILFLTGIFCLVFALYETMEYMLCYNDEKRQQQEEEQQAATHSRTQLNPAQSSSETELLLQPDSHQEDTSFLRDTQAAFEEEEDDMFFLHTGNGSSRPGSQQQAKHTGRERGSGGGRPGETIAMSTLRMLTGGQASSSDRSNHSAEARAPARTLGPDSLGLNSLDAQGHRAEAATMESRPDCNGSVGGPAKSSILPDMWKALAQDSSDSDSQEDVFSRGQDGASASLLASKPHSHR